MTTNTISQEASFRSELLPILRDMYLHFAPDAIDDEIYSVLDMIDAKLAQAREEGILFERKRLARTIGNANDLSGECLKQRDEANARAIAAEKALEAVRRGVEGLARWSNDEDGMRTTVNGRYVLRSTVLALLQPQAETDTGGLPG